MPSIEENVVIAYGFLCFSLLACFTVFQYHASL